ncbi:M16 family metallopeptidase [Desertibaculum subflavum]|uniref:M16 family metallopeptidase n=1 Tax=Desertibaculum subflavum TaxID=2268458 RepID=UPI000E662574
MSIHARMMSALAAAAAVLAAVALASPAGAASFDPKTFRLASGLDIVVIEDHRAPVVHHMVWYRVGAADEPPGKSGIAHFLEHLMFKGTKLIGPGEFSKIVARNGGRDNAFTSQDYTGYFQTVAVDKLDLVMGMEADRMANLAIPPDEVEREREVILEERRSRTDNNPGALLAEQMTAALYLAHPYRIPVIGWMHEMQGLTHADAVAFHQAHYAPNNAILVVAGDVQPEAVRALAEKHFGPIPARELKPRKRLQEPPHIAARRVTLEDARVKQSSLSRYYLAPSYSTAEGREGHALTVLAEILGDGRTGRLHKALVVGERAPAVSVSAWYQGTALDLGSFGIGGRPRNGTDLAALETAIDKVIAELLENGITEEELARAKSGLLAGAVFARDSISTTARIFGSALTTGSTVEAVEVWPERIEAVTAAEVLAAARKVLDPRRSVTGYLLPKPTT